MDKREEETKVLREGAERQIEALEEKEYKESPSSWNTLSALGQKNAKNVSLLFSLPPFASSVYLPQLPSLAVCFKMSAVPLRAAVDCFVFSSVVCCRACVCGCMWESENFCTFCCCSGL